MPDPPAGGRVERGWTGKKINSRKNKQSNPLGLLVPRKLFPLKKGKVNGRNKERKLKIEK